MNISKQLMDKFIKELGPLKEKNWFRTLYWYITDRRVMAHVTRLDRFLADQLENPAPSLELLAFNFRTIKDPDKRIVEILKWVYRNIKYTSDDSQYGTLEMWATGEQTLSTKKGDCEDMNSLIYLIARLTGITEFQMMSVIGKASTFGHYWLLYFSTKTEKWYAIDSTAWMSYAETSVRPEFELTEQKYNEIWYMFNEQYIYKYN